MQNSFFMLPEENVQARDYPFESEAYGDSLAKLGIVLGQDGEVESACHYLEQGLRIMYALRDSGRYIPRSTILTDISDAEEGLGRLQKKLKDTDRSTTTATQ